MSTAFKEATKRAFGDRAQTLLDAGAIMPVTHEKHPALPGSWTLPTDPARMVGRDFYGYAVKTGAVSGLTGVDFDGLVMPSCYNTVTKRGFHSWVAYEPGDSNRRNINDLKVDVRGDGGFLVFASPSHTVVNNDLLSRDDFNEWLHPITMECAPFEFTPVEGEHPYLTEVSAYGYEVRIDWIVNRLASIIASSPEGSRNHTLYVSAAQVINLGGTENHVKKLEDAAYEAGLEGKEIGKTLGSAQNASEVIPVFEIARAWATKAEAALRARRVRNTVVVEHIVRLATEQHSLRPLVSIQSLEQETGQTRKTIGNQLNMLIKDDLLTKKVNPGRQPNGNLHPNNYIIIGGN